MWMYDDGDGDGDIFTGLGSPKVKATNISGLTSSPKVSEKI